MKVGDLVKPWRSRSDAVGLVTRIRKFDTRDNVVYVQWTRPAPLGAGSWSYVDRWYDVSNLSKVDTL